MNEVGVLLAGTKQCLAGRDYQGARATLKQAVDLAQSSPTALSSEQAQVLRRYLYILAPAWSEPLRHGVVQLRRCHQDDEPFFRSTFQDRAFVHRFNRQRPWSGDLGKALNKFGHEPPVLLKMLQWVVCLREEPVGLISLSHLDLAHSRAEFSIGFPVDMSSGISHKACLLALHFAFFVAGLNKLYGYVYEGNDRALQAALRIGFVKEGFLAEHFRFQPSGFVGVHVIGLTKAQALANPELLKAVIRRTGRDWRMHVGQAEVRDNGFQKTTDLLHPYPS